MKTILLLLTLFIASNPRCLAELLQTPEGRLIYFQVSTHQAFVVDLDQTDSPVACLISDAATQTSTGIHLVSGRKFIIDPDSLQTLRWEKIQNQEIAFSADIPRILGDTLYVNQTKRLHVSILKAKRDGDISYHFSKIVEQSTDPTKTILRDCLFITDPFTGKFPNIGTSESISIEERGPTNR